MTLPTDHAAFLRRHDFVAPAGAGLDERERALLLRYGRWLEALATGQIQPLTPEQEHFLAVCRGAAPPTTEFERAWVRNHQTQSQAAGPLEVSARLARLAEARRFAAAVHAEHQQRRDAVLETVRAQLEQIDTAFADELRSADEAVSQREAEVREAVLQAGESARHDGIQAVYVRGRVTWDGQGLTRYAESHPEVQTFRKVGPPSVRLRYEGTEG